MGAGVSTEVLLVLLDVGDLGIVGGEVQSRLADVGKSSRADQLLVALLRLEGTGHVAVDRSDGSMRFALTLEGRARAYELGGGEPVHLQLLMTDLVGFTAFTSVHGDAAAREAAGRLHQVGSDAVRNRGGEVVKALGDGLLAWLPPPVDPLPVVAELAAGCEQPDGEPWLLRAASHVGHPIRHHRDLFGGDVNLVARLCAAAAPGELVRTADGYGEPERLDVRGLDEPVDVWRVAIP